MSMKGSVLREIRALYMKQVSLTGEKENTNSSSLHWYSALQQVKFIVHIMSLRPHSLGSEAWGG